MKLIHSIQLDAIRAAVESGDRDAVRRTVGAVAFGSVTIRRSAMLALASALPARFGVEFARVVRNARAPALMSVAEVASGSDVPRAFNTRRALTALVSGTGHVEGRDAVLAALPATITPVWTAAARVCLFAVVTDVPQECLPEVAPPAPPAPPASLAPPSNPTEDKLRAMWTFVRGSDRTEQERPSFMTTPLFAPARIVDAEFPVEGSNVRVRRLG